MNLSIIILTWNSKSFLQECLASIENNVSLTDYEVIVIDNKSNDGTKEFLQALPKGGRIRVVYNQMNLGVAPARNQGLAVALGRYILILDVDTIVHKHAVEILIEFMEAHRETGLCGPRLVGIDGELQFSCRKFPNVLSKLYRQLPEKWQSHFLKDEELRDWNHDCLRNVGYVIGACQLIRRQALNQVGLLDGNMFYGVEEIDLCLRLWKSGWKVAYNPQAVVTHIQQRLGKKSLFNQFKLQHAKSLIIYFWKHRYLWKPPNIEHLQQLKTVGSLDEDRK